MITPVYHELSKKIKSYIKTEKLTGRLPGKTVLAKKFGVNHVTVMKSLRELADQGVVACQGTRGTFVCEKPSRPKYGVIGFTGLYYSDNYCEYVLERLNERLKETSYRAVKIAYDYHLFEEQPELLTHFPVDGFVFLGSCGSNKMFSTLKEAEIPLITIANPNRSGENHVSSDHWQAYGNLLDHLLKQGIQKIAFADYERRAEFHYYLENIREIFQQKLGEQFRPEYFQVADPYVVFREHGNAYHQICAARFAAIWKHNPPEAVITCLPLYEEFCKCHLKAEFAVTVTPEEGFHVKHLLCAVENAEELLYLSARRMIELLHGDESVQDIRVPFIIKLPDKEVIV